MAQSSTTRRYRSAVTPANIATSAMRCVMKFSNATDCHRDRIPIMKSTTLCPSALAAAMTCPTSGHSHAATEDENAFAVVERVQRAMREAGVPTAEVKAFTVEACSGDYYHLLETVLRTVETT